jgi:hypothetical protein
MAFSKRYAPTLFRRKRAHGDCKRKSSPFPHIMHSHFAFATVESCGSKLLNEFPDLYADPMRLFAHPLLEQSRMGKHCAPRSITSPSGCSNNLALPFLWHARAFMARGSLSSTYLHVPTFGGICGPSSRTLCPWMSAV